MKTNLQLSRELASRRSRELQAAGIRQRPKSWGGKPSAKQSRKAWKNRGEE